MPNLKTIVQWGGVIPKLESNYNVLSWQQFMNPKNSIICTARSDEQLNMRIRKLDPGHACTLIFTSGTTGVPKVVMLSHDNITWTARVMWEWVSSGYGFPDQMHHVVSYFPLSHIAAQMQDMYCAMFGGCTVWFASPDALRGSLSLTLKEVRPTLFFGVPRVWEKFQERITEVGEQSSSIKKFIVSWAKGVGQSASGGDTPWGWSLASFLVFSKVKKALGLDRCIAFYSGAAPLQKGTEQFFHGLGIPIRQLFGMSECSGPHTVSVPWTPDTETRNAGDGTCGTTMWGCKTRICPKTQEVQLFGRNIMMGYMNDPEATVSSINTETGFLCTGDLGLIDVHNRLKITGRIKELINTAGGEKISPLVIENGMKAELPYIQDCMAVGDQKKYIAVLLTLRTTLDSNQAPTNNLHPTVIKFANRCGSTATTVEAASKDRSLQVAIQNDISRANDRHIPSRAMRVKQWAILTSSFTVAGGELGPTAKLRRNYVLTKYSKFIEDMYTKLVHDPPQHRPPQPLRSTSPVQQSVAPVGTAHAPVNKSYTPEETSVYVKSLLENQSQRGIIVYGPQGAGKTFAIDRALTVSGNTKLSPVALLKDVTPETVKDQISSAQPRSTTSQQRDTPLVLLLETRYTPAELGISLEGFIAIYIPKYREWV